MALSLAISGYKSVNEFLGNLVDAIKDTPWPKAVSNAVPWLGILGEGVADSVAPVKFILKLYEAATRIDDVNELGEVACTVAFQRSVQQSLTSSKRMPMELPKKIADHARAELRKSPEPKAYDFKTMQLADATQHEFFRTARARFQRFLDLAVADEAVRNELLADVERRFVGNLELLLTNGDTKDKFDPFYRLILLDKPEQRAYEALRRHAAYQRWMYEERRILREEPYALQHTYVRTDCGVLRWGDLEQRRKDRAANRTDKREINPFLDHQDHGGRTDSIDAVFKQMADPNFRDLIVIQGPAGTGKSSLTLRLCVELLDRGLQPIRIELKHLDTSASRHVRDTLPEAVRLGDGDFDPAATCFVYEDGLFLDNKIFAEQGSLNGTTISRCVLILDAWDEISIGAEEGYQQHVERLVKEISDTYLDGRWAHPVRVILTGRPTEAVTQGRLLRDDARLLTLRYFTPVQLKEFHMRLGQAVKTRPIASKDWMEWALPEPQALTSVRQKYTNTFESQTQAIAEGRDRYVMDGDYALELLGSPLLGLLSLRLLARWSGDPISLFDSHTVLYRSLVDLLLGGGKAPQAQEPRAPHLRGIELRELLWSTAEAMTVLGREGLPKAELLKRVETPNSDLDATVGKLTDEARLSRLLVSFFFHGGRAEQGCEFSHKSFREYLFAEQVVAVLKSWARTLDELPPERDVQRGYWRDFPEKDPRQRLSRRLAELLGPQWLTRETGRHLAALIEWEVQRAAGSDPYPSISEGLPTEPLTVKKWALVRDALADVWDWWAEGVHLRPQPSETREVPLSWGEPVAMGVAKRDRLLSRSNAVEIRPPRIVTIDSHLGDSLFQLCCDVHRALCRLPGKQRGSVGSVAPRRYQCVDTQGRVHFLPGGQFHHWDCYYHRIEAAGYRWRFRGGFPHGINLSLVVFIAANMRGLDLSRADLYDVTIRGGDLRGTDLRGANLCDAFLAMAFLRGADLSGAQIRKANLFSAELCGVSLGEADLREADLREADLRGADLRGADLRGADLRGADLRGADLREADLRGADLRGAKLRRADLSGTLLEGAKLPEDIEREPEDDATH